MNLTNDQKVGIIILSFLLTFLIIVTSFAIYDTHTQMKMCLDAEKDWIDGNCVDPDV